MGYISIMAISFVLHPIVGLHPVSGNIIILHAGNGLHAHAGNIYRLALAIWFTRMFWQHPSSCTRQLGYTWGVAILRLAPGMWVTLISWQFLLSCTLYMGYTYALAISPA